MRFIHRGTVSSTQDEVRRLYESGERGPLWLSADEQVAGRGRLSRRWESPRGNLFTTGLYPTDAPAHRAALYGFATAVALARALDHYNIQSPAQLKWPNDVLVGGAKIAGILIEREAGALMIGTGLNLVSHPSDTPYPVTHLLCHMHDDDLNADEPLFTGAQAVLAVLAREMINAFSVLEAQGFEPIRTAWLERAYNLGRDVRVGDKHGKFTDLRPNGALCLTQADGTQIDIHTGDVSFG